MELMTAVETPTDQLVCIETPCANTVQGLTPMPADINSASPNPKRIKPIISIKNEITGGLNVNGFGELQNRIGITFILKMSSFISSLNSR